MWFFMATVMYVVDKLVYVAEAVLYTAGTAIFVVLSKTSD